MTKLKLRLVVTSWVGAIVHSGPYLSPSTSDGVFLMQLILGFRLISFRYCLEGWPNIGETQFHVMLQLWSVKLYSMSNFVCSIGYSGFNLVSAGANCHRTVLNYSTLYPKHYRSKILFFQVVDLVWLKPFSFVHRLKSLLSTWPYAYLINVLQPCLSSSRFAVRV